MGKVEATLRPMVWLQAVRSDARLSEAFLPRITPEEEAAIATLLEAVVSDAQQWCDERTLFNRGPIFRPLDIGAESRPPKRCMQS